MENWHFLFCLYFYWIPMILLIPMNFRRIRKKLKLKFSPVTHYIINYRRHNIILSIKLQTSELLFYSLFILFKVNSSKNNAAENLKIVVKLAQSLLWQEAPSGLLLKSNDLTSKYLLWSLNQAQVNQPTPPNVNLIT